MRVEYRRASAAISRYSPAPVTIYWTRGACSRWAHGTHERGRRIAIRLKKPLPIPTRYVLDYFHVATKVRHADQCIGRIPPYRFSPDGSIFELYGRFNDSTICAGTCGA